LLLDQAREARSGVHFTGGSWENNDKVDEFYRAPISAGAGDNISPRARMEYYPGYYAAEVFHPDGYSFEVVQRAKEFHIAKVVVAHRSNVFSLWERWLCLWRQHAVEGRLSSSIP